MSEPLREAFVGVATRGDAQAVMRGLERVEVQEEATGFSCAPLVEEIKGPMVSKVLNPGRQT